MAVQSASAQFYSSETEPLQPRIEAGAKVGTERSIGSMEGWMPLAQDSNSVLYADIRWTADDGDNREGNLGLGYRKIVVDKLAGGDAIIGGHGWIDRRRTDRGSTFHQITAGAEYLKEDWDVKANAYIPLNKDKEYFTPNIGSSTPYLAGTGIFVDTNGSIIEEAQPGGDVEVGYRLSIFESKLDAVRVYGGGYAFIGDQTDDVIGGRVRASVDVNPLVNVGARFQYDEARGSQGFLEATLRFPFSAKKRFKTNRLRARLDESPERDIDIVTGSKVDNGLRKEVVNAASGQTQRVIHVDNTAANGGNGSVENPFNTLAAAQAAMLDNDVIYVHRGDGTTTGMNQGILINKNNVQLIGSGTDFVFDTDRFTTRRSGQKPADGTVIIAGGAAPVITNITVPFDLNDHMAGNGVLVTGDKALVAGITVNGAQHNGIAVIANGAGNHITDATVLDVTSTANARRGILAYALNSGVIDNVTFSDSASNGNLAIYSNGRGFEVRVEGTGSAIGRATITNSTAFSNTSAGVTVYAVTGGQLGDIEITGGQFNANQSGIIFGAGTAGNIGSINSILIQDNQMNSNTQYGFYLTTGTGAASHVGQVQIRNNIASSNSLNGIQLATSGIIDNAVLESNRSIGNLVGFYLYANGASNMQTSFEGNTTTANTANGVYIDDDTTGTYIIDMGGGSTLNNTGSNRIYGNTGRDIRVDLDGGALKAENNWWGSATGLDQGTQASLDAGGNTIDATPFLPTDPGI